MADLELARASKRLIITAEAPGGQPGNPPKSHPHRYPLLPGDAVVQVPFGSYPGNMPYEYFSDEQHLNRWLQVEKDPQAFQEFLERYIYGVEDFDQYLELCGGLKRLRGAARPGMPGAGLRNWIMSDSYNPMEMMICAAARCLEDGKTVAVGTGAPCAAAMLPKRPTPPNLMIAFEAGGMAPRLKSMPISVGDSRTFYLADSAAGMAEMMTTCARGLVDYAFLGGAQIDRFGNLNSTCVGDYAKPKVRFPGSGGANDFASPVLAHHDYDRAQPQSFR